MPSCLFYTRVISPVPHETLREPEPEPERERGERERDGGGGGVGKPNARLASLNFKLMSAK